MATIGANVLTISDWAKRRDPDGKTARIVELLAQTNDVLTDMLFIEGNLPTGHRTTVRTGLPTVVWRLLNEGVTPTKSKTAQITETIGILESWSEVDKDLADLMGDQGAFRLGEAQAFLEAMSQEFSQTLFFGNSSIDPEEFTGLAPRYSDLSADIGQNILDAGGTGSDNSSVWLVSWGENTVAGIFPKGSQAGILHEDLGLVTVETTAGIAGQRMRAYQDRWQWKAGLCVKDWRYAVRIANIDISDLVAKSSAADLIENMIKAMHRLPSLSRGKPVFYMNRTCFQQLDIQRRDDVQAGGQLKYGEVDGKIVPTFRGVPIRMVDQLTETEAQIT